MSENSDKEFLEFLVKSIVDHPEQVVIERKIDEMGVLLSLKVARQDMGQVVGRDGSTAKAIRSLLRIVGVKNNARVNLKIEEPDGGEAPNKGVSLKSASSSSQDNSNGGIDVENKTPEKGAVEKVIEDIKDL